MFVQNFQYITVCSIHSFVKKLMTFTFSYATSYELPYTSFFYFCISLVEFEHYRYIGVSPMYFSFLSFILWNLQFYAHISNLDRENSEIYDRHYVSLSPGSKFSQHTSCQWQLELHNSSTHRFRPFRHYFRHMRVRSSRSSDI